MDPEQPALTTGEKPSGSPGPPNSDPYNENQIGEKPESGHENDGQGDPKYPSPVGLALIALGLCFAVFLVALDQTIVANAIPKITDEFNSVSDIGWYGSAFLLTTSSFQIFYGKAYTYFSIKYTFLLAIGIFELGSLVCGLAPNSRALIIGRAVAGLGGSGILAGALIIIAYSVPLHKRPMFLASFGGMFGIASVSGPLLGGVFTDKLTWRWCFYINLPFGAVTILAIWLFFKPPERPEITNLTVLERFKKIDWLGLLLFIPSVVSLLLALQWGGSTYPWNNGRIIALFVVFGVLGIAFGFVQAYKKDSAIIPPRVITQRSVAAGAWYAFCNGAGFLVMVYYTPLWHQVIRGLSAVESGIRLLPLMVGVVIMVMMSGAVVAKTGYYAPLMILSSIIAPIGEGLMSTWTVNTTFSQWFGYEALTGLGIGLGMQQPMIAIQTALPIRDVPVGTSIIFLVQTLGAAIFITVAQSVFQNRLIRNLQVAIPGAKFDASSILQTGATDLYSKVPAQLLPTVRVSFNNALTHVFTVSICMSALTMIGSLAMEWRSVKKKDNDKRADGNMQETVSR